jgi:Carbohydrate family 9 binding domain-like
MVAPIRSSLATAILLFCSGANACDLSLVAPANSDLKNPVQANVRLTEDMLTVRFAVTAPSLNAKKVLGPKEYPYMFDVVELFVTFSETGFPYYEFEVSPYNQTFQVRILSAKQHQENVDLGLISTAIISQAGWTTELKIPLKPLGWDGDAGKIRGNLYSVLGLRQKRSYWSAFLPRAKSANFHQPQYFKPLLSCG